MNVKSFLRANALVCVGLAGPAVALDDPTRPSGFQAPVEAPAPQATFSLESIMIGGGKRLAVINGQMVREGQTLESARVVRVTPERVVLSVNGQQRVLRWHTAPQVRTNP
ncbi:general secretion pathway protein GspB [Marinobacter fonticola]|uniref:general secretion pathway protein GspB n=1 Tax=Marinobacter fonticola TaxID=2603215 RepID=UPI0011E65536|nr:general secretion pathway protein GspB [Marinobacter fonticola]